MAALRDLITVAQLAEMPVFHRDGTRHIYGPGTEIPLSDFGGPTLPVDEIFA